MHGFSLIVVHTYSVAVVFDSFPIYRADPEASGSAVHQIDESYPIEFEIDPERGRFGDWLRKSRTPPETLNDNRFFYFPEFQGV